MSKNESLKLLAKLAKRRLKNNLGSLPFSFSTNETTEYDQKVYDKIFFVLKNRRDTPTPIGEIIDYEKFNKLSSLEREIYIFDLIDKFNYCKQHYNEENERQLA